MSAKTPHDFRDDEARRALEVLSRHDAADDAIDAALSILARVADDPQPSQELTRRIMFAVGQAPLAEGRVPLGSRRTNRLHVASVASVVRHGACGCAGTIRVFGPDLAPGFAGLVGLVIGAARWCAVSIASSLRFWNAAVTVAARPG